MSLAYRVHGMDCAEEVALLRRELLPLVGDEEQLVFDLLRGRLVVSAEGVADEAVRKAVARTGLVIEPWEKVADKSSGAALRKRRLMATIASGTFTTAGLLTHAFVSGSLLAALSGHAPTALRAFPTATRALYLLGILASSTLVLPKAWHAARRLRPDMNLLMTVAVIGALAIGEWFEAAAVSSLFALSLGLEAWSVERARRAVEALMDLSPETGRVRRGDGREDEIPVSQVTIGSILLVHPGERIPLDGRLLAGTTEVDQAPITGESVPVPKDCGDEVFAGTINGDGSFEMESTSSADATTLAKIVRMVGEARGRRAPSERRVEGFARVYTPIALLLAVLIGTLPPLLLDAPWEAWLYRSLVLLVIACPCALVISTPVSIVAALAAAARNGILIKGGAYIEAPARLRAMAMDKTGTLTLGKPAVVAIAPLSDHDETGLLERALALEARSNHPLARAIGQAAEERRLSARPADDVRIIRGKGATGRIDGRSYWLGSHRYLEERGQETPGVHAQLESLAREGHSVIVVGNDSHVCGFISLADSARPDAAHIVGRLHDLGVEHVAMLTGDNEGTARAIARETHVDEVSAELLPADKVTAIESLLERFGSVAMVGDGVNDAPAMAQATLGIAMGAAGSDAAIETADIALMSDELGKLPWLIRHSRRTIRVIRQNVAFALAVKLVVLGLAAGGVATLWLAIAADMGASLLVISNGLRLLGQRPDLT